jgi:putative ABC transport system substrate-binding protein
MNRLIIAIAIAAGIATPAVSADYKVLVATWRGCEEACQGFQDYLTEKDLDVEFILRDAAQNTEALPGILSEARESDVDLLITWGTSVTRGIAGTLEQLNDAAFNHDIPQVFMIVADPVGAGVIDNLDDTGRPNITGTFNRMPEEVTIETIRAYDPTFKHLGMLYNTNEQNSVLKLDEMTALAETMGFDFTSVELPLAADGELVADDIAPKVAELKAAGVDFIYVGSSSFLRDNGAALASAAIDNELPVLSPYEQLVLDEEALISVAARYYDVGRLAGIQAERILGGENPGDLPVLRMTDFAVVINLNVAEKLNKFPSMDLLQVAETVN